MTNLTFIVTVDPVKELSLLGLLIHSLNLQTCRRFNVVFHNQTLMSWATVLSRLSVAPAFDHRVIDVDRERFLGAYPIWDVYELHQTLLEGNAVNEYFCSLHMENFLDCDYVEQILPVLEATRLDILFGNMTRSRLTLDAARSLLAAPTDRDFSSALRRTGAHRAPHWSFDHSPLLIARTVRATWRRAVHLARFRFRRRLRQTAAGYTPMPSYFAEDVYWMSRAFALRHNWFLRGHHLFFEDVSICQQPGVGELGSELQRLTRFPLYFNRRRVHHVPHRKYYFQVVDDEFTTRLLDYPSSDPGLEAHKTAIRRYRRGEFTFQQALRYTRRNSERTGTQDLNYRYHMLYLNGGSSTATGRRRPSGG